MIPKSEGVAVMSDLLCVRMGAEIAIGLLIQDFLGPLIIFSRALRDDSEIFNRNDRSVAEFVFEMFIDHTTRTAPRTAIIAVNRKLKIIHDTERGAFPVEGHKMLVHDRPCLILYFSAREKVSRIAAGH